MYEEQYFSSQCVLICECDNDSDNGKTVSATNGKRSFTGTVEDKKCILLVPGKVLGNNNEYTVSLLNSGLAEYSTTIKVGFGDVITIPMAEGHDPIIKKNLLTSAEQVIANTENGMVADALALKEITGGLTFGQKDGKYGYFIGGASTEFNPFRSDVDFKLVLEVQIYEGQTLWQATWGELDTKKVYATSTVTIERRNGVNTITHTDAKISQDHGISTDGYYTMIRGTAGVEKITIKSFEIFI